VNPNLELWQLALGLVIAITLGAYGLRLMRTPISRPRIIREWPKLNDQDTATEDLVPPSQRKSYELQPPNTIDFSSGG
jgi:hypothetical protein